MGGNGSDPPGGGRAVAVEPGPAGGGDWGQGSWVLLRSGKDVGLPAQAGLTPDEIPSFPEHL